MPQARVAFQYPSFRYFMTARFLTTAASEMQSVAVAWQVYSLTNRPLDLGLVGLAQFLPGMVLFLVAGHTAASLASASCKPATSLFPCARGCWWR